MRRELMARSFHHPASAVLNSPPMMRFGLDSGMAATAVTLWPQRDSSRALDRRKLRVLSPSPQQCPPA